MLTNLDLGAAIADIKDTEYKNTLAILTLIELLIEKDLISPEEFRNKANQIDSLPSDYTLYK